MTNKGLVYLVDQKTLEIDKKMRNNPTEKKQTHKNQTKQKILTTQRKKNTTDG